MKIDILVLNYNGRSLLERFLPSVVEASRASLHPCNVILVDNASSDGSPEFVKSNFPSVSLYQARENKVLFSYNDVVEKLDSDIVIFLNNDIKVDRHFIDALAGDLYDKNVFFSAPKVLNPDGTYNGGRSRLEFKWGIIKSVTENDKSNDKGPTHFISCGAFQRKVFLDLGGFDELYMPGIWEDVDLCYRGLKSGFRGIYNPRSIIWHDESTTFKKVYGYREKMIIAHRNMFLFFWKNINDFKMLASHIALVIPMLCVALLKGQREIVAGFVQALQKLGKAVKKRTASKNYKYKDGDILIWKFL